MSTSSSPKVNTNVTPAAADRRLAGRRRFYKHVGIAPASPPGDDGNETPSAGRAAASSVDSPISAGVDGTRSATGVTTSISDAARWSSLLNPARQQQHTSSSSSSPKDKEWHTVTLDGRAMRTPLGLPLSLPSLHLALAVASEWDAQRTYLQPAQMPLMTLCCTAIDQVASDPTAHRTDVMRYLRNDTSCYWACPAEDRSLYRRQSKVWEGLHDTLSNGLLGLPEEVRPAQAHGGSEALLLSRRSEGNRQSGLPHPPVLVTKAELWVETLDAWTLTALYSACAESKSFFIGAALVHDAIKGSASSTTSSTPAAADGGEVATDENRAYQEMVRDGKWAAEAARVEEEFNIECWGLVEGGHDYDRLNCSIQMHAAAFLARTVASA